MKNRCFFLLGSERSGSNLLCSLIDRHTKICSPSPVHLLRLLYNTFHNYKTSHFYREEWLEDVWTYFNAKLGYWNSSVSLDELVSSNIHLPKEVFMFLYAKEARYENKDVLFIKENKLFECTKQVEIDYTPEGYVYLVRDPRSFVCSYLGSANHPGGIKEAVELWKTEQKSYLQMQEAYGNRVLLVKYEALLRCPLDTIKCLLDFFKVEHQNLLNLDPKPLHVKNAATIGNWSNVSESLITNKVTEFETLLCERDLRYIEKQSIELMQVFGYAELEDKSTLPHHSRRKNFDINKEEEKRRQERVRCIYKMLNRKFEASI